MKLSNIGQFKVVNDKITAAFAGKKSEPPVINIPDTINENEGVTGSFSVPKNASIYFDSAAGIISNINIGNGSFTYMAPDITNDADMTTSINAYITEPGKLMSDKTTINLTIKYVSMQTDDALVDNNFNANAVNTDVNGLSF